LDGIQAEMTRSGVDVGEAEAPQELVVEAASADLGEAPALDILPEALVDPGVEQPSA